jgi:hypothetical protein
MVATRCSNFEEQNNLADMRCYILGVYVLSGFRGLRKMRNDNLLGSMVYLL